MAWHITPFDSQRYVDIKYNEEPVDVIPECVRSKVFNRFMDVLPNPRSRVKLPHDPRDPTADYVNANYIHGFDGSYPAYIAAMGYALAFEYRVNLHSLCAIYPALTPQPAPSYDHNILEDDLGAQSHVHCHGDWAGGGGSTKVRTVLARAVQRRDVR